MRKPQWCILSNASNCEDCQHWEPIPFHDRGGECIPKLDMSVVWLYLLSNLQRITAEGELCVPQQV